MAARVAQKKKKKRTGKLSTGAVRGQLTEQKFASQETQNEVNKRKSKAA